MKRNLHLLLKVVLLFAITGVGTFALDINYVGSIEDSLYAPTSVQVSNDRISVLEPFSRQLKIYTPDGIMHTQVNLEGSAFGLTRLNDNEYIFCNRAAKTVDIINISSSTQSNYFGAIFNDPIDIAYKSNHLFVLDAGAKTVLELSINGELLNSFEIRDNSNNQIKFPSTFDYDPALDKIYIFDQTTSIIWTFSTSGNFINNFGSYGNGDGQITRGGELLVGPAGRIYIADRYQGRVVIYDDDGIYLDMIDMAIDQHARLSIPSGLAIDNEGILYVSSTEGTQIDLFHISKPVVPGLQVNLNQMYPPAEATVSPLDLHLIANAESKTETRISLLFDFELFEAVDLQNAIISTKDIEPTLTYDSLRSVTIHTAEFALTKTINENDQFFWRTRFTTDDTTSDWSELRSFKTTALPIEFDLQQNYPNPFNPTTWIRFSIPAQSYVTLEIYNLLGQKIRTLVDNDFPAGNYNEQWDGRTDDGRNAASGIYFYRLSNDKETRTRKMVLVK